MLTSLKRIMKLAWQGFTRNGGLSAATIFIMVVTISSITSLFLFQGISKFLISEVQEKVDVSVYFNEEVEEDDVLKVKEEISQIPEVKNVEYVSKENALESFTLRHKNEPALIEALEVVGINPFLASLNIKASQAFQYEKISNFLENGFYQNLIYRVDYYQKKPIIEKLFSLTADFSRTLIILSLIVGIFAILIAFNQIRLSIYSFREEIGIQRLVGASNWFIRSPFLIQGVIVGLLSALISLLVFFGSCYFFGPKIEILFPGLSLFDYFLANLSTIFWLQILTGVGLGVISSLIAIRKYLKV